ncbi:ABC transporter transmembrane domain-containing protein [Amycolatopsis jejuensis]|uniref:ABC transporter transmembrane domain-containing protein n=1 Tax=Amycolatopsis jejuensis TaxID=330084 RepID=UPI000690DF4C|nr:ABC transporter ATP-binding protein [Amycolatopsis jejuensis]
MSASGRRGAAGRNAKGGKRFLLDLARAHPVPFLVSIVMGALWILPGALFPFVAGDAIDEGILSGDSGRLFSSFLMALALVLLQALTGGALDRAADLSALHAAVGTQRKLLRHVTRLGSGLPSRIRTGNVVAMFSADVDSISDGFEIVGRTVGAVLGFGVVAVLMMSTAPELGWVVLLGVPIAVVGIRPLLAPLRRRNEERRDELDEAAARSVDAIGGLRVLRGIGGERRFAGRFVEVSQRVRRTGEAVGRTEAWLTAAGTLLPGLITVGVVWLGARLSLSGDLAPGRLVTLYGAAMFLWHVIGLVIDATGTISAAAVAADRIAQFRQLTPVVTTPREPTALPSGPFPLHDSATGMTFAPGKLTTVSVAVQDSQTLGARLAGYHDTPHALPVRAGEVPLHEAAVPEVRQRILLCRSIDVLLAGRLGAVLRAGRPAGEGPRLSEALRAADVTDVVEALPAGLDEEIDIGGRRFSGGQRQRLVLARALYADPGVLILEDPTSAVDAHTEARIAAAVANLRRGRTTIVLSQSSLWSDVADHSYELPAEGTSVAEGILVGPVSSG